MNKKINYGALTSVVLIVVLLVMSSINMITVSDLKNTINKKDNIIATKDADITKMTTEIATLNQNLIDAKGATKAISELAAEEDTSEFKHLIDGYFIGDVINEDLSDRELSLFDGEIEYDDEDYNADEYVIVGGKFVANEDDMDSNVYMSFNKGDIMYSFVFEDTLDFDSEESLKFNFLGEELEVTEWENDKITIKMADEMIIAEGDTISVDNNSVFLDMVMEDSIWVTVNEESEKIKEGDCKKIDNMEVCVSSILYSEKNTRVSKAIVSIASDVEEEIESGDQYMDSEWSWYINYDSRTIGLVLSEDFEDLDEDFKPLGTGDSLCLPNKYVCMEFAGLSNEDFSDIDFRYDLSDDETKITGDFENGTEDVEEIIINSSGMYYEDDDDIIIKITSVDLKDSDVILSYDGNNIALEDIIMPRNLSIVEINANVFDEEGTYRSVYGSIAELDDDLESNEDNEVSVSIPEEKLELSFFMY